MGGDAEVSEAQEVLEGYVVDLACVRRYSREELALRATRHTRACVLMGHCIESGYALISASGDISILDTHATPHVVRIALQSSRHEGLRVRAFRTRSGEDMRTTRVEEVT